MADDEFRKAVADVRPLKAARRTPAAKAPPPPIPVQRMRDERAALVESIERPVTPDEALAPAQLYRFQIQLQQR